MTRNILLMPVRFVILFIVLILHLILFLFRCILLVPFRMGIAYIDRDYAFGYFNNRERLRLIFNDSMGDDEVWTAIKWTLRK